MGKNKKRAAVICACVIIALLAGYLGVVLFSVAGMALGQVWAVLFVAFYAVIILAIAAGVLLALRQRLREIDGGEEEEAQKY